MMGSVYICSMSSFTKIRASVNFHPLKPLSICPVNFRTNSQAEGQSVLYFLCPIYESKVIESLKGIFLKTTPFGHRANEN